MPFTSKSDRPGPGTVANQDVVQPGKIDFFVCHGISDMQLHFWCFRKCRITAPLCGRILRWTSQVISKDNGAIGQIFGNNIVAANIVEIMWQWQDGLDENG